MGTCGADDNQAQAGHIISTLQSSQTGRWSVEGAAGGQLIPETSHCLTARSTHFDPNGQTFIPEKVTALTARCGNVQDDQQVGQLIAEAATPRPIGFHLTQHPVSSEEVFPAMGAGNAQGCATMAVAYSTKLHNTNGNGAGKWYEEYTAGLDANSPPPVVAAFSENQRAEVIEHDIAHQLTSGGGKPGQGYAAVRQDMAVRRLTPLECERLMGLPDGWTEFGVNEAGKTVKIPDTHRYRCLGNSVAVPMAAWVARRLVAEVRSRPSESLPVAA